MALFYFHLLNSIIISPSRGEDFVWGTMGHELYLWATRSFDRPQVFLWATSSVYRPRGLSMGHEVLLWATVLSMGHEVFLWATGL
jgi:hypothetical protein